jgi:hypothetical protein
MKLIFWPLLIFGVLPSSLSLSFLLGVWLTEFLLMRDMLLRGLQFMSRLMRLPFRLLGRIIDFRR